MASTGDIHGSPAVLDKLEKGKGTGETTREQGETTGEQGETTKEQGETTKEQGETTREQGETTGEQGETTKEQGETTREQGETTREQGETTREQGAGTREQGGRSQNADQRKRGIKIQISEAGGLLKRVQNLTRIKGNKDCNEALKDWKNQKKSLGGKLDRKEKRVEELTNQVYNLVGFFSVFQGVILTAVSQLSAQSSPVGCPSKSPLCKKVWFPIALSLLAALAAVIGIGLKFWHINKVDFTVQTYRHDLMVAEGREATLIREGDRIDLESLEAKGSNKSLGKEQWLLKAVAVIGAVIAFTVLLILSYLTILCDKFV